MFYVGYVCPVVFKVTANVTASAQNESDGPKVC